MFFTVHSTIDCPAMEDKRDPSLGRPPGRPPDVDSKLPSKAPLGLDIAAHTPNPISQDGPHIDSHKVDQILKQKGFKLFRHQELGRGNYGIVYMSRRTFKRKVHTIDSQAEGEPKWETIQEEVACKVVDIRGEQRVNTANIYLPRELQLLQAMKHPNLVQLLSICGPFNGKVYIFMELAGGGDLLDYLLRHGAIPEGQCRSWFDQMAKAMNYCHHEGIAHRDMKGENCLLDQHGGVKITDFGMARAVIEWKRGSQTGEMGLKTLRSKSFVGSRGYQAPELLRGQDYNPLAADIWSLGVTFFLLLNNRFPFRDLPREDLIKVLESQDFTFSSKVVDHISSDVVHLIVSMLEPDPGKRATIGDVLKHRWFHNDTVL